MTPYKSHEKKALLYAIRDTDGTPLDLLNVQVFKDGEMDSVGTFIGRHDRDEFVKVAETHGIPNYSRFVQQQERLLSEYLKAYHRVVGGGDLTEEEELIEMLRSFHNRR